MRRIITLALAPLLLFSACTDDERPVNRDEYLYDATGMLNARLTLDLETGNIHIIKYLSKRR